jgi:hypothetical protein
MNYLTFQRRTQKLGSSENIHKEQYKGKKKEGAIYNIKMLLPQSHGYGSHCFKVGSSSYRRIMVICTLGSLLFS